MITHPLDQATKLLRTPRPELLLKFDSWSAAMDRVGELLQEADAIETARAERLAKLPPFDQRAWLAGQIEGVRVSLKVASAGV